MPDDNAAYDDGSEVDIVTDVEDPPRSGKWVDAEAFVPTDDELEMGQLLGETIDVDDDDDNGAATIRAIEELIL